MSPSSAPAKHVPGCGRGQSPRPRTGNESFKEGSHRTALLCVLLAITATVLAINTQAGRFMRFAVAGQSMSPALPGGAWVIVDRRAYLRRLPAPGEIVVVPDPRQPRRLLVKRVRSLEHGDAVWLEGDNALASTDSRTFGTVPASSILGRVRWRYAPWAGTVQ